VRTYGEVVGLPVEKRKFHCLKHSIATYLLDAALIFRPRIGLKRFIRDYFAIDTNVFVAVAIDDLFPNRQNHLDPYDVGIRLGLRIYFR
jgi:hypothetical protein